MNMIEKCFLVKKMDECRNTMLHQILSYCHVGTLSKSLKKRVDPNTQEKSQFVKKSQVKKSQFVVMSNRKRLMKSQRGKSLIFEKLFLTFLFKNKTKM